MKTVNINNIDECINFDLKLLLRLLNENHCRERFFIKKNMSSKECDVLNFKQWENFIKSHKDIYKTSFLSTSTLKKCVGEEINKFLDKHNILYNFFVNPNIIQSGDLFSIWRNSDMFTIDVEFMFWENIRNIFLRNKLLIFTNNLVLYED